MEIKLNIPNGKSEAAETLLNEIVGLLDGLDVDYSISEKSSVNFIDELHYDLDALEGVQIQVSLENSSSNG